MRGWRYLAALSFSVWLLLVAMEPAPIVTLTVTVTAFLLLLSARCSFFESFSVAVALVGRAAGHRLGRQRRGLLESELAGFGSCSR